MNRSGFPITLISVITVMPGNAVKLAQTA
jgi:hypothetical protein